MPATEKITWLKKDRAEWKWALRYIEANADWSIARDIRDIWPSRNFREPNHEIVEEIIRHLHKTEHGRDFIKRLRNALRQHRYRSSTSGKQISTFALPTKTKNALRSNARRQGKSESDLVTEALDQSGKLIEEHRQQEQRLKKKHELELTRAKQRSELLEIKHHEAMRQIQKLATRLAIWELALEAEHPGITVDRVMLDEASKAKTRAAKKAIKTAVERWKLLQPRLWL